MPAEGHTAPPAADTRPAALPSPRVGSCLLLRYLLFFPFTLGAVTRRVSAPSGARATRVAHANAASAGRGGGEALPGGLLPRRTEAGKPRGGSRCAGVLAKPLGMGAPPRRSGLRLTVPGLLGPACRALLAEKGRAASTAPRPGGRGGARGRQGSSSGLHPGAQQVRGPRGEPRLHPSVLSAGLQGGSWRRRRQAPQPFLWLRPRPLPSREGGSEIAGPGSADRPFGECHSREFPDREHLGTEEKSPRPHPRSSGSALPPTSAFPPPPLSTGLPLRFNCLGPPAPPLLLPSSTPS